MQREAAAAPSAEFIRPTNVTMPDGSTQLVQTRTELAAAQQAGATLPQGGTQQRPMTEKQMQARLAVERMEPALEQLFAPGEDGMSLYDQMADTGQRLAAGVPGIGNFLTSESRQRAENLIREAVGAGLRFETGAAITPAEVQDTAERYAPRPGDQPGTIAQKRAALENYLSAIQGMVPQAGSEQAPTAPPQAQPAPAAAPAPGGLRAAGGTLANMVSRWTENDYAKMTDEQLRAIASKLQEIGQ